MRRLCIIIQFISLCGFNLNQVEAAQTGEFTPILSNRYYLYF